MDNLKEVIEEVKSASEEELREVIEKWFEDVRTLGLKAGAKYIAAGVYSIIVKHTKKQSPSLRDYKRMTEELIAFILVQLKEDKNDGTTEETD